MANLPTNRTQNSTDAEHTADHNELHDGHNLSETHRGRTDNPHATTAAQVGAQPVDADLTAIAALDSATEGAIASDGAGWIKKTYAQFKTALGLVKADVGLGNVDNTSDTAKPISTATQTALDTKAAAADLTAHLNDTVDAHDASAISVVPFSTIAATDVQAALEEVKNEAGGGGAQTNVANTWTEDQTIASFTDLLFGQAGSIMGYSATSADADFYLSQNAKHNGTNWVRTQAVNPAMQLVINGDNLILYAASDAGNTVGSTITWAEKFRITKAGLLSITKGVKRNVGSVLTADITISTDSDVVLCGGTVAWTLTLPTAVGNAGKVFDIKRVGTAAVTIDANGTETIDGALTHVLSAQYESRTVISDGANWHII